MDIRFVLQPEISMRQVLPKTNKPLATDDNKLRFSCSCDEILVVNTTVKCKFLTLPPDEDWSFRRNVGILNI